MRRLLAILTLLVLPALSYAQRPPNPETSCDQESVRRAREEFIPIYLAASAAVGEFANITHQTEWLTEHVNDNTTFTIKGLGTYVGVKDVLEYCYLTNPTANGGQLKLNSRQVMAVNWTSADVLDMDVADSWEFLGVDKNSPSTSLDAATVEHIEWAPCEALPYLKVSAALDGVKFIRDSSLDQMTPTNICTVAALYCSEDLFPFSDVQHCLEFMAGLPMTCEDGVHSLQGNTTSCRYTHATAARLDPIVHCQHIGPDSHKCYDVHPTDPSILGCEPGKYAGMTKRDFGEAIVADHSFNSGWYITNWVVFIVLTAPAIIFVVAAVAGRRALRAPGVSPKAAALDHRVSTKAFTATTVAACDLYLNVNGKSILNGVSVAVRPREIIAIMGVSGAGKSTLLNAMAGVGVAKVSSGELGCWNDEGRRLDPSTAEINVALVEQDPAPVAAASARLTVLESIVLEAIAGGRSPHDAKHLAEEAIAELSLTSASNTAVANLSGGQLKRWSIAARLPRCPAVLLLDEPTSSLDGASAISVMLTLRSIANAGRAVALTLHQPSAAILDLLDGILLLKSGGIPLYCGPVGPLGAVVEARVDEAAAAFEWQGWTFDGSHTLATAFSGLDIGCTGRVGAAPADLTLPQLRDWSAGLCDTRNGDKIDSGVLERGLEDAAGNDKAMADALLGALATQRARLGNNVADLARHNRPPSKPALADVMADMCDRPESDLKINPELALGAAAVHPAAAWAPVPFAEPAAPERSRSTPWRSMTATAARSLGGTPILDLIGYPLGALVVAAMCSLLFPRLVPDSVSSFYLYAAALLVAMSALVNLAAFNFSMALVGRERAASHALLNGGNVSPAGLVWSLAARAALFNWAAGIMFFFLFYFVVNYYINDVTFGRISVCFLTLLLMLNITTAAGDWANFMLPPSGVTLVLGVWLAWNVLFSGVLIPTNQLFVIWKPWAAYVTPFWQVENAWLFETLVEQETACGPRDLPQICAPDGTTELNQLGYGQLSSWQSQWVLMGTLIAYRLGFWASVAMSRRAAKRRRAAVSGRVLEHVDSVNAKIDCVDDV